MTSKQDFTDEEWTRIRRAPLVAGVAISLADRNPVLWGGSVLAARAARRVAESIRRASGSSLLTSMTVPGVNSSFAQVENTPPRSRLMATRMTPGRGRSQME